MIDQAKQHAIFLASIGKQTYQLIKNFLEYGKLPKDKSYKELTDVISKHKNPTPPRQAEIPLSWSSTEWDCVRICGSFAAVG